MTRPSSTALGGALERHDGGWRWRDGTSAPEVRDIRASSYYDFRCHTPGGGVAYVEVPVGTAMEEDCLRWIYDAHRAGRYAAGRSYATAPVAIMIPVEDWDAWASYTVIGAEWDRADEDHVLARAREQGLTR